MQGQCCRKASDAGTQRSIFVNGRSKVKNPTRVVNLGRPRILLISVPKATYRPILQPSLERAVWYARCRPIPGVGRRALAGC